MRLMPKNFHTLLKVSLKNWLPQSDKMWYPIFK